MLSKFWMEIAYTEEERVEIRAQAMIAISDLSMPFPRFLAPISIDSREEKVDGTEALSSWLPLRSVSLSLRKWIISQ